MYLLMLLKQIQPKEKPGDEFFEFLRELRRINLNMDQIAVKADAIGFIDAEKYWENADRLSEIISSLKDYMMQ